MTDTNKERENLDNICLNYRHDFGLMPLIHREALRAEAREWLRAIENSGWQLLGDRGGWAFTMPSSADVRNFSDEMGLGFTERQIDGVISLFILRAASLPQPRSPTFAKPKPLEFVPEAHPVDGELTRPISGPLSEPLTKDWFDQLWKSEGAWGPVSRDNCWKAIEAHVAATEARVRGEYEGRISEIMGRLNESNDRATARHLIAQAQETEIKELHATIADLNAKLETAVQIPWDRAPDGTVSARLWWYCKSEGPLEGMVEVPDTEEIPRPTPKTLTIREKIDAVKGRFASMEDFMEALADDKLTMLQKLDELYAEVVKDGEK